MIMIANTAIMAPRSATAVHCDSPGGPPSHGRGGRRGHGRHLLRAALRHDGGAPCSPIARGSSKSGWKSGRRRASAVVAGGEEVVHGEAAVRAPCLRDVQDLGLAG